MDKNALDEMLRLPKPRYEAELPLDRVDLNSLLRDIASFDIAKSYILGNVI